MGTESAMVVAGAYVELPGLRGEATVAIPLLGVKVLAEITAPFTRVVMSQRFRNDEEKPIEAVYVFPAPEKAAVTGLVIESGGRRIVGRVTEKEEAFDIYDEALAAGHGAALFDQHRPNVFQASVGNLLPGQEMVVELTWVMELGWEGEALRFTLPTTVAPRYAPAEDRIGVGQSEAEKVNPPTAFEVPFGLEFKAEVDIPGGVAGIESPSHPLRWKPRGEGATVELSHETAAMNEDLVLLISPAEPREPHVVVEKQDDGSAVAGVSFLPKFEVGPREPREVIFIIDRSGSMRGGSIEEARRALQLCLRSLQEGDRFDIISFGSHHESMFGKSRAYSQTSLEEAAAYAQTIDADMGGTEILRPLTDALGRDGDGTSRAVILLTDGEVSNEARVIELASRHAGLARVFTIGIGHGPSEHLIKGVARASGGAAEFIKPGERIEPKVLRQFARLGAPVVEDLRLEWNGEKIANRAPWQLVQLFDGEPFLVYVRLPNLDAGTLQLAGQLGGHELNWELSVDPAAGTGNGPVGALAARAEIRDLEEGTSRLHDKGGSRQKRRREVRVTKAIVDLGVRHQLASSETSFVAIEEREGEEAQERGRLVLVPQALTRGWHGAPAASLMASRMSKSVSMDAHLDFSISHMSPASSGPAMSPPSEPAAMDYVEADLGERGRFEHDALTLLQRADGSWVLDRALADAVGVRLKTLRNLAGEFPDIPDPETVVATAAALEFLRWKALDTSFEWRLLAKKAEVWLDAALAGTKRVRAEVMHHARKVLRRG